MQKQKEETRTERRLIEGPLRTARQTHHSNEPYGSLLWVIDGEHSPGVLSRPEGLGEGGLWGEEYLKVPPLEPGWSPAALQSSQSGSNAGSDCFRLCSGNPLCSLLKTIYPDMSLKESAGGGGRVSCCQTI